MIVVKLFSLEALAAEVLEALEWGAGGVVRVERSTRVRQSGGIAAMERRTTSIHVRAVVGSEVLAFMLTIGSVEYLHGEPFGVDKGAPGRLDDLAERWAGRITCYLEGAGLRVRPGLIDLGGAEPIPGSLPAENAAELEAELEAERLARKAAKL